MSISDIINPWGALRRERQRYDDLCANTTAALRNAERKVEESEKEAREARLRAAIAKTDITKLEAALKEAHFRNPKTGRLGRKGERF